MRYKYTEEHKMLKYKMLKYKMKCIKNTNKSQSAEYLVVILFHATSFMLYI